MMWAGFSPENGHYKLLMTESVDAFCWLVHKNKENVKRLQVPIFLERQNYNPTAE